MHRDWPLFALPLLMVAVLAVSVLVSASPRTIVWSRVYGGPTDADVWHGRLQVQQEHAGVSQPLAGMPIRLRWVSSRGETLRDVTTGHDGWLEFSLPRPQTREGEVPRLVVSGSEDAVLAEGHPDVSTERFVRAARRRGGNLAGHEEGQVKIRLRLTPPVLSVPFEAQLSVQPEVPATWDREQPVHVHLQAEGLDFDSKALTILPGETRTVTVMPRQHVVTLRAEAKGTQSADANKRDTNPPSSRFTPLPVVPGSMGLSESPDHWVVSSPTGKKEAWYALVGPWGRGVGGRVALQPSEGGLSHGRIDRTALPRRPNRYLLLSSSPDGRSPSTVGYPLDGQRATFDAWDAFVLDGGPPVRRAEARRIAKVRWVLGGYAALCGFATLILFVRRVRVADQDLKANLRRAGAGDQARESSAFPAAMAIFSLVFAFSLAVLWIVAR